MLSYQHAYHAGNLADVHKHALLATALDYLTRKDKPLTYIETHAGRGLYRLDGPEAAKTGEAAEGIAKVRAWFPADHPYARALEAAAPDYPGSPWIARHLLRPDDRLHLAELHPAEHAALAEALAAPNVTLHKADGPALALSLTPPTPRRGLMLIDPSYEVKDEYAAMAGLLPKIAQRWNVGVLMLWYPILATRRHGAMTARLRSALPGILIHEVGFAPARPGQGLVGSGLAIVNAPWGLDKAAADLAARFAARAP